MKITPSQQVPVTKPITAPVTGAATQGRVAELRESVAPFKSLLNQPAAAAQTLAQTLPQTLANSGVASGLMAGKPYRTSSLIGTETLQAAKQSQETHESQELQALKDIQTKAIGDQGEEKQRGKKRAALVIKGLKKLRDDLLTGGIDPGSLAEIVQSIALERKGFVDPVLNEILDDIDLRAQVELAKYQQKNNL